MVGQLVEVFRHIDTVVPEQVIDVPKISSSRHSRRRRVRFAEQMAEQLVEVLVASPRDCVITATLTEVVLARRLDTAGRQWWLCAVARGVVLVACGHTVHPSRTLLWDSPPA